MRQLGKLDDPVRASAFTEYLIAQGILAERKPSGGGWAVWVRDEDHFERALAEWRQFQAQPDDERYYQHGQTAQQILQAREEKRQQAVGNLVDARRLWDRPAVERQPLTLLLIGVAVVFALWTRFGNLTDEDPPGYYGPLPVLAMFDPEQKIPVNTWPAPYLIDVMAGQVWRLVTPIFIHFGFIHLLFNMLWLYRFGCLIEDKRGTWFLAILVVVSAVVSNLGEYYMSTVNNVLPLVGGMSGVVYALFGFIWIKSLVDRDWLGYLDGATVLILVGWVAIGLVGIGDILLANVGHWAHAFGLLTGMAFAYAPYLLLPRSNSS